MSVQYPGMELSCSNGMLSTDLSEEQRRSYVFFRAMYNRHPALGEVLSNNAILDPTGVAIPPRFDPVSISLIVEVPSTLPNASRPSTQYLPLQKNPLPQ